VFVSGDGKDNRGAIEFLRSYKDERFFLYVHFMDAHQYLSDEESAIFGTTYSDLYDNSVHWTDRQVAAILAALDQYGLRDETLVVIASDHGEAFLEHGNEGHAKDLHREVVRTPWILSFPFSLEEGIVVDARSENVDLWPTVLDLVGQGRMEGADGRSRVPEMLTAAGLESPEPVGPPRPSFAELDRSWGKADLESSPLIAVTTGNWRYMRGFGPGSGAKLFDLTADPLEKKDLLAEAGAPLDTAEFEAEVEGYLDSPEPAWRKDVGRVELDDMQKGQLRAIGYAID
ncbi:MAG TPA: sulfatase-like hydrolase/transferase, partial [Myxococcota bacterium]|nr:sulfatase-like hydrolase/transferase [Myxococcota bacterium]